MEISTWFAFRLGIADLTLFGTQLDIWAGFSRIFFFTSLLSIRYNRFFSIDRDFIKDIDCEIFCKEMWTVGFTWLKISAMPVTILTNLTHQSFGVTWIPKTEVSTHDDQKHGFFFVCLGFLCFFSVNHLFHTGSHREGLSHHLPLHPGGATHGHAPGSGHVA